MKPDQQVYLLTHDGFTITTIQGVIDRYAPSPWWVEGDCNIDNWNALLEEWLKEDGSKVRFWLTKQEMKSWVAQQDGASIASALGEMLILQLLAS